MNKKLVSFILVIFFVSCVGNQGSRRDQSRLGKKKSHFKKNRKRGLFVVTKIARVQSEPSTYSRLVGVLRFKARVRVLGLENPWVLVRTPHRGMVGYVHRDSLMPLRMIKRFLKKQEMRNLEKKEEGVKKFSESDELVAGTKGFSEDDAITAGTKGFSEDDEIVAGTKGLNNGFEKKMEKEKPEYRYDLVRKFIKNGGIFNPFRRLRKFRRKRKIGEFYRPAKRGKLRRQKRMKKRFDRIGMKIHDGFLPSEEYYIGRTTAAYILSKYKAYGNGRTRLERYINNIARTLSMASSRPEVFKGYRIIILDSDKKNAFANPGGFIFITTGLLKLARHEDEIAGVLAHEVAHIALRHPTKSINAARRKEMLEMLAKERSDSKMAQHLMKRMGGSMNDMFQKMKTGMDSRQEKMADKYAVAILMRVGYEPLGLVRIIKKLNQGDEVHGDPMERAKNLKRFIRRLKRKLGQVTRVPKFRRRVYRRALKVLNK